MTFATLSGRESAAGARWWLAGAALAIGLLATLVLGSGSALAAAGTVVLGLSAVWLALDFTAAATALLAGTVIVPNGVALYFGPTIPLLTFQRAVLLFLLAAAIVHYRGSLLRTLWSAPGIRLLWSMVVVLAVSTVLSFDPGASQKEFFSERELGVPILFAVLWLAVPDRPAARRLVTSLAGVGLLVSLVSVIEAITGLGSVASLHLLPADKLRELGYNLTLERRAGFPRVESVFQHPLILGAFLVVQVPLVAVLRRHAATGWARFWWTVALVLGPVALVLTWSRGAWVALLLALLLSRGVGTGRWLLAGAGTILFLVVWSALGFLQVFKLVYRWWLLSSVLRAMWGHFGFGSGPSTFIKSFVVLIGGTTKTSTDALAYSLTMAIEAGPIFVLLLWWFVWRVLRRAKQARQRAMNQGDIFHADLLDGLRAGLLANLLLSAVSASLFGPTAGLYVLMMLFVTTLRLGEAPGS